MKSKQQAGGDMDLSVDRLGRGIRDRRRYAP